MMVERKIQDILQLGITWFTEDTRRVEAFFLKQGLSATEAANIRTYYGRDPAAGEKGGPPTPIQGYPRTVGPFPCYAIVLSGDPFKQTYLGDDMDSGLGSDDDDDGFEFDQDLDGNSAQKIGRILDYQFDVEVWAMDSPDICLYFYHLLRYIIFSSLETFLENGLDQVEYAGRDIDPRTRYIPENMWVRALRLTMIGEEKAWESLGIGKRIDGAFVEGGPEDDSSTVTRAIVPIQE